MSNRYERLQLTKVLNIALIVLFCLAIILHFYMS